MRDCRRWTRTEIAFVTECTNAGLFPAQFAPLLDRTVLAIQQKRCKLGIRAPRPEPEPTRKVPFVADIKRVVADHFGVPIEHLTTRTRTKDVSAEPRHIAMFLARTQTGRSYRRIAQCFNRSDHTTVRSAEHKVRHLISKNAGLAAEVQEMSLTIEQSVDKPPFLLGDAAQVGA